MPKRCQDAQSYYKRVTALFHHSLEFAFSATIDDKHYWNEDFGRGDGRAHRLGEDRASDELWHEWIKEAL